MKLITPDSDIGSIAGPDVITTNLEAYTNGIKSMKEKTWEDMGAKKIGNLWKGKVNSGVGEYEGKRGFGGLISRKNTIKDDGTEEDSDDHGKGKGAFARTGQAFKGLVGYVL
jgi:hypothetical protein